MHIVGASLPRRPGRFDIDGISISEGCRYLWHPRLPRNKLDASRELYYPVQLPSPDNDRGHPWPTFTAPSAMPSTAQGRGEGPIRRCEGGGAEDPCTSPSENQHEVPLPGYWKQQSSGQSSVARLLASRSGRPVGSRTSPPTPRASPPPGPFHLQSAFAVKYSENATGAGTSVVFRFAETAAVPVVRDTCLLGNRCSLVLSSHWDLRTCLPACPPSRAFSHSVTGALRNAGISALTIQEGKSEPCWGQGSS